MVHLIKQIFYHKVCLFYFKKSRMLVGMRQISVTSNNINCKKILKCNKKNGFIRLSLHLKICLKQKKLYLESSNVYTKSLAEEHVLFHFSQKNLPFMNEGVMRSSHIWYS